SRVRAPSTPPVLRALGRVFFNLGNHRMLQKLNERLQGLVAWVVIVLVVITFTMFGVDYYLQGHQTSTVAADVNGQSIPKQWVDLSYQRLRQGRDQADMNVMPENQLKQKLLDDLILRQVSLSSATHYGFGVTPAQADGAIVNIPQFQKDGKFSSDQYQQVLSSALFTPQSFQEEVRQGMVLNQQRFAYMGTEFVLPHEIKQYVKFSAQKRNYRYVNISIQSFLNNQAISEQEIAAYYQAHEKDFYTPEQVAIDYVQLSMKDVREKVKPSDEAIQQYYDDNQADYLKPAEWKVDQLVWTISEKDASSDIDALQQKAQQAYDFLVHQPEKFDAYAQTQAIENIGKVTTDHMPWVVAGSSSLDKVFSNFSGKNTLLAPEKTDQGFVLYKLVDYRPSTVKPFSQVRDEIKEQLVAEISQSNYAHQLELLTDQSYQVPDTLSSISDSLRLPVQHSSLFSRQGGSQGGVIANPLVTQAAFSHDILDLENNSAPIQLDSDSVIVLRVAQRVPAQLKPLALVHDVIQKRLAYEKATAQAQLKGEELLALKTPEEEASFMKDNHDHWQYATDMMHDSDAALSYANELAFTLPHVGARSGRAVDSGYLVVVLESLQNGKLSSLDKEQIASISQQIEANFGVLDYDLYINQLVSEAKVKRYS
ncbi:MAG: SurA N-terminal domain-containing protein, partial [Legionellaceae bacterium]